MSNISSKEFDADVLVALKILEKESINNNALFPFPKTIASFLLGKTSSPFYKSVYSKYPNVCGSYTMTNEDNIEKSLERMRIKGILIKTKTSSGKDLYKIRVKNSKKKTPEEIKQPKPVNDDMFYELASKSEKIVLDDFRKLIYSIFPNIELQNTKATYGFKNNVEVVDEKGNTFTPKLCWISRDSHTKKLKLHYKKRADGAESSPLELNTERQRTEAWRVLRVTYNVKTGTEVKGIVQRIINGDTFDEYNSPHLKGISLMPHQKAGVLLAKKYDRFAFFYDTGTGKTIMALEIMMNKAKSRNARFLVVAPKALIKSAWLDDSKCFPKMKLLPLSTNMTAEDYARLYDYWREIDGLSRIFTDDDGNLVDKLSSQIKNDIIEELYRNAEHFIINIDAIREPEKGRNLLKKINVNGLIIDESVIIKNYRSGNAKRMRVFAKKMKYIYLLSGKPAPNTTIEYYSQMVIIDPKTFDITYDSFISKYYKEIKPGRYVDINDKTRATVAKMVSNRSIIIKKEECIKLPEAFHQKRFVECDSETMKFYNDVLSRFMAEITTMDGEKLRVRRLSRLGSIMKLREIASGFYLDKNDSYRLNPNKIAAIKSLLDEIGYKEDDIHNKVLIWCTFKFEIEELEKQLSKEGYKVVTAYSKSGKQLDNNIASFKHGDADIMIAHPQTLKYGVTFTKCHYCIFSSMSYSYDDYYQAHDRIYRNGQEEVCFFYHLLSEDTIDEIIYKCVIDKDSKTKLFERLVKSAQKHGISKDIVNKGLHVSDLIKNVATNSEDLEGSL